MQGEGVRPEAGFSATSNAIGRQGPSGLLHISPEKYAFIGVK